MYGPAVILLRYLKKRPNELLPRLQPMARCLPSWIRLAKARIPSLAALNAPRLKQQDHLSSRELYKLYRQRC